MKVIKNSEGVQLIPETTIESHFIDALGKMGQCEVADFEVNVGTGFRERGINIRSKIRQTTGQRETDITPQEGNIENPDFRENHKIGGGYSGLFLNGKEN